MTPNEHMMRLLGERVPVTLLLDLLAPPEASEMFSIEGGEADWLADLRVSAA